MKGVEAGAVRVSEAREKIPKGFMESQILEFLESRGRWETTDAYISSGETNQSFNCFIFDQSIIAKIKYSILSFRVNSFLPVHYYMQKL